MSSQLSFQKCEACQANAPRVNEDELSQLIKQIPDWSVKIDNNIMQLERQFIFKNFKQALDFTNKIGLMAENESHHPCITTEWGKVTVCWWSHSIKGLHQNDFICAAKTDKLV